jgi:hypothetical protein
VLSAHKVVRREEDVEMPRFTVYLSTEEANALGALAYDDRRDLHQQAVFCWLMVNGKER